MSAATMLGRTREALAAILNASALAAPLATAGVTAQAINKADARLKDKMRLDRATSAFVLSAELPIPSVAPDDATILLALFTDITQAQNVDLADRLSDLKDALLDAGNYVGSDCLIPLHVVIGHPQIEFQRGDSARVSINVFCYCEAPA